MRLVLRGARAAVVFLTRVPVGGFPYKGAEWRWAAGWFPLIGAVLGVLLAGAWSILKPLGPLPAATLVLGLSMLLTGGFHEDGLADTADALGGATGRDRIFEILKDSRIGSFGALALLLSVLLRASLLASLSDAVVPALVLSQCIARMPPVWMMVALPYVSQGESAKSRQVAQASWRQGAFATAWVVAAIVALVHANLVDPRVAAIATAAALLGAAVCAYRFLRRAGGVTGDFLGATEQVGESLVLIVLVLMHSGTP